MTDARDSVAADTIELALGGKLAVLIILIPATWGAIVMLSVATCRMAALGDETSSGPAGGSEIPVSPVLDELADDLGPAAAAPRHVEYV